LISIVHKGCFGLETRVIIKVLTHPCLKSQGCFHWKKLKNTKSMGQAGAFANAKKYSHLATWRI
jgi:hypothetical protein